jgi:hypothetical protein
MAARRGSRWMTAACVAFGALTSGTLLLAQATTPPAAQPAPPAQPRPGQAASAPVAATPAPSPRKNGQMPQGFSVVLVLGDLQATSASDDVPPAARKALTDMRDFLPFKSYRLLDAAWLLCCAEPARRGGMSERRLIGGENGTVTQALRGPDEQEYELRLSTTVDDSSRVFVHFALANARFVTADDNGENGGPRSRELADLMARAKTLQAEIDAKRAGVRSDSPELKKLESELRGVQNRITALSATTHGGGSGRAGMSGSQPRSLIDTSFTMDVGETVVVGTSRLRGGNRALIALLTAVPPRAPRRE